MGVEKSELKQEEAAVEDKEKREQAPGSDGPPQTHARESQTEEQERPLAIQPERGQVKWVVPSFNDELVFDVAPDENRSRRSGDGQPDRSQILQQHTSKNAR